MKPEKFENDGKPDKHGYFSAFNKALAGKLGRHPAHEQVAFSILRTQKVVECDLKIINVIIAINDIKSVHTGLSCYGFYGPYSVEIFDETGDFYEFLKIKFSDDNRYYMNMINNSYCGSGKEFKIFTSKEFKNKFNSEFEKNIGPNGEVDLDPSLMVLKNKWWADLERLALEYKDSLLES